MGCRELWRSPVRHQGSRSAPWTRFVGQSFLMSPGIDASDTQAVARRMVPDLRRLGPNIVLAGVLPLVGYSLLRPHVDSDATALAAVMVFPLADIAFERHRHGGFEPIGVISLIGITLGLVGAVVFHGDTVLLKLRESVVTGLLGIA